MQLGEITHFRDVCTILSKESLKDSQSAPSLRAREGQSHHWPCTSMPQRSLETLEVDEAYEPTSNPERHLLCLEIQESEDSHQASRNWSAIGSRYVLA